MKRLGLLLLSSLVTLGLLESAVRLLAPASAWRFRDKAADWQPDPTTGWTMRPRLDVATAGAAGEVLRLRTNEDGLQPAAAVPGQRAGALRVLIVGDSTVAGLGVPEDRRLHVQLARRLAAAGVDAEVDNAGVEGFSTDQALLRLARLLPRYRPDLVLYGFCDNDLGGNLSTTAYGMRKPRFELDAGGALRPIPLAAPNPSVPPFAVGPRAWVQHLALFRLLRPRLVVLRARFAGAEQANLLGIASDLYWRPESYDELGWPLFARLLSELAATARAGAAGFAFFSHPSLAEVWEPYVEQAKKRLGSRAARYDPRALERHLFRLGESAGVAYLPTIDDFLSRAREGPFHLLPDDPHCNAKGYEIEAVSLARQIVARRLLPSPAPAGIR